jgi:3,4-dihydroxy-9,10-secoandrosta-1,3,5(10)-triene-9,17-dione 4,5-dioxygenase
MAIKSLGYIGINSAQLPQWQEFACQVMGLEDVSTRLNADDDTLFFKMDDHPYRFIVNRSDEDKLGFCGWETNSEQGLQDVADALAAAGTPFEWGSEQDAAARSVSKLLRFADPSGTQHEAFYGVISDFKRMNSPVGVERFITGDQGLGHVVIPAPNFDATSSFFTDVLGFGLSDLMKIKFTDDPNEPEKRLWFMHCNTRHHSLALFEMPMPTGCVHLMVEVPSVDEVGLGNDRRIAANVKLTGTLGRHANDHMVSFYMRSPSGFDIEYGAEGRTVDDWDNYPVFHSTVASFWGHDFSVGHQD